MSNELMYEVASFVADDLQDHYISICGLLEFIEGNNSYLGYEGSEDVLRAFLKAYKESSAEFIRVVKDVEKTNGEHSIRFVG